MIKNYIFLALFSINVICPSYAYNKDPFQRWNRLENLIVQETKLLKQMMPLTFKEEYRLVELLSERLKIIKKKEHYKMITEKMGRERINQKIGENLYREIFARGKKLLKRKISKVLKARILYTLALNSRDYKLGKLMIPFLTKALTLIKQKTPLALTIHVQMAEFYYNKKQFKKAKKHYQRILKGKENKWYLKHLLNSAWCDFKLKKIEMALRKIKETLLLNLTGRYNDNKFAAFEGFIVFSTYGNKIKKALRFLKKNKTYHKFDNTLKFAQFVSNQGLYNESLKILKFMDKENETLIKNSEEAASLSFFKLMFFDKFSKEKEFYLNLSSLKMGWEEKLPEMKKRGLAKKLREKSSILQKEIYQKKKMRTVLLKRFEKAMDALIYLEPKSKGEFFYYLGEMFLFFGKNKSAIKNYKMSAKASLRLKIHKGGRPSPFFEKSLLSLLNIYLKMNKKNKEKQRGLLWVMTEYLHYFPKGKYAASFYQQSLVLYLERDNLNLSEKMLMRYKKNRTRDKIIQTDLLKKVISYSIKKRKIKNLTHWISMVEKGEFKLPSLALGQATEALAFLLFSRFDKMKENGHYKLAKEGYDSILQGKRYPQKIKAETHLRLALLYSDEGHFKKSFEHLNQSIDLFDKKAVKKHFSILYHLIRKKYFVLGEKKYFKGAEKIWRRICSQDIPLKEKFSNDYFQFALFSGEKKKINMSLDYQKICLNEKRGENQFFKILDFTLMKNDWATFLYFLKEYPDFSLPRKYFSLITSFSLEGEKNEIKKNISRLLANYNPLFFKEEKETMKNFTILSEKLKKMTMRFNKLDEKNLILDLKEIKRIEKGVSYFLSDTNHLVKEKAIQILFDSYNFFLKKVKSIQVGKGPKSKLWKNVYKKIIDKKEKLENNFDKKGVEWGNYPVLFMVNTMDL